MQRGGVTVVHNDMSQFQDETNGTPIRQFAGTRSKMYSILVDDGTTKATAKGISKATARKHLRHELYCKAIFDRVLFRHTNHYIRSNNHLLTTTRVNKISLCGFDDKRYILGDGVSTLAYGHCDIP